MSETIGEDRLFSVRGQIVLAIGASRGIGRTLASGFAQRGATVVIAGRDRSTIDATARELSATGNVIARVCDVANPESVTSLVDGVVSEHGRIDTLLNVAGINVRKRVENYTVEEFDRILDTNLRGLFVAAQTVGRTMIGQGSGAIVNIDSLNTYAPLKGVTPYAMSKGGVSMMTRGMALEWGPRGVRVNAIAPGFFPTELSRKLWTEPGMMPWAEQVTPLGGLGDTEDLVGAAIFLASKAGAFVTGQVIRVDGGVSAGLNWPIPLE
ncbi:MAG: SDR family oxidoreductase [Betaproteobacteria bacterium]|nr:SDR family oxidoreductase [Betaproteobacteria bacterium]